MSLLDENIEIPFEALLESLGWFKVERYSGSISYTYSGLDCADRYFSIDFFPKGYIYHDGDYVKYIVKKSRKDRWHIYYQYDCMKMIGGLYPIYMSMSCDIRMDRENVIQLMNDIKNRNFNLKNYKFIKR